MMKLPAARPAAFFVEFFFDVRRFVVLHLWLTRRGL